MRHVVTDGDDVVSRNPRFRRDSHAKTIRRARNKMKIRNDIFDVINGKTTEKSPPFSKHVFFLLFLYGIATDSDKRDAWRTSKPKSRGPENVERALATSEIRIAISGCTNGPRRPVKNCIGLARVNVVWGRRGGGEGMSWRDGCLGPVA